MAITAYNPLSSPTPVDQRQDSSLLWLFQQLVGVALRVETLETTVGRIDTYAIQGGPDGQVALNTVSADNILAGTITANEIAAGTITANNIAAGTITGNEITSDFSITGKVIRTAPSGARVEMDGVANALRTYDSTGTITVELAGNTSVVTGGVFRTGLTHPQVVFDTTGIRGTDSGGTEKFRFDTGTGSLTLAGVITAQTGSAIPVTYVTSGNIVSGTVITIDSGGYLQTASVNPRVVLDNSGLRAYNSGGVLVADVNAVSAAFTGATFQTAAAGAANRVVLDSSGLRGYAADGATETVNVGSGTSTITGGTFRTAAPGSSRVEILGSSNTFSIYSGSTENLRLDPTVGLTVLTGNSAPTGLTLTDGRLSRWRQSVPSGTIVAGTGAVRYTDGSGTWNWGVLIANLVGTENTGALLSAGDSTQARSLVVCWNQPSAASNKRRIDLTVRNDANGADYTATLRSSDGRFSMPGDLIVFSGAAGISLQGSGAGNANVAYMAFNDVNGVRKGFVGDNSSATANIVVGSDSGTASLFSGSDATLKDNVRPAESQLDLIRRLHLVRYERKATGRSEVGLIAQEVIADLGSESRRFVERGDEYLGIHYTQFIPALLGGVKELDQGLTQLRIEVDAIYEDTNPALIRALKRLDNRLAALEKKVAVKGG